MSSSKTGYSVVLQSLQRVRDEIDEVIETIEILGDEELLRGIKEGLEEAKRGEGTPIEELLERVNKALGEAEAGL